MEKASNNTSVAAHNDGIAEDYRFWSPGFNIHFGYWCRGVNPFDREAMLLQMNEEVLQRLQLPSSEPRFVVDAGCGAGATLRYMAERFQFARFAGVTLAPLLLNLGKKINEAADLADRIELIKADFQSMPLHDACADAVFCLESACYAEGKDKAGLISELYRILKPGGKLVVVDAFRKHSKPFPSLYRRLFEYNSKLWAVKELAEIESFKEALEKAGFRQVKIEDISWRAVPTAMHIPFVVLRLLWHGSWRRNDYWKALSMTLLAGTLTRWMGYYVVSGEKAYL